jgi:hypothetical protein
MTELERNLKMISFLKKELCDKSARLLNLTISGSDLYGFRSEDSDIDYRGVFITDTNKLLGLSVPRDVFEKEFEGNDIVLFELQKEINLALKGNCNVLEHISAKQIYSTPEFLSIKPLVLNALGKDGLYNSYKGMAQFNYKKFVASGQKNTVKKYLYVFRGLLAGIYVLETSEIEPNINTLNAYFKIPEIKSLIKLKVSGKENDPLPENLDRGQIEQVILNCFQKLDSAYQRSKLQNIPSEDQVEEINKWLINVRKKMFLGESK